MPWKETCAVEERLLFIADWLKGLMPMSMLCEHYGISRKTGYKWVSRYRADPVDGLCELSRAPHHCARAIDVGVAARIVALRQRRPHWGPRKLLAALQRDDPAVVWPAASTIGDLLRREGLSEARRRRRRAMPRQQPFLDVTGANDVWCADFKGWFRTSDGERCDPLTISDAHSRFLLDCKIVAPTGEGVQPRFERAFREFGLPLAIRTDNGPPFASTGAAGLSRLSIGWLKLGIKLERIDPGQPQQNGRHERMHRTLKGETSRPPAPSLRQQQRRFDRFRQIYNEERPHEALNQEPPAAHYQPSPRPYPTRIPEPWYDAEHAVRQVRTTGEIKWGGDYVFISESLTGEPVGIAETEQGDWLVRFMDVELGVIDRHGKKLRRFSAARPGRTKARPEQKGETVTHVSGPKCYP
jgi:transposase InsO family protein